MIFRHFALHSPAANLLDAPGCPGGCGLFLGKSCLVYDHMLMTMVI